MGKKKANISRRVKTRHKKSLTNKKIVNKKVEAGIKNINKFVSDAIAQQKEQKEHKDKQHPQQPQIDVQPMSMAEFQKLMRGGEQKKQKLGKLSIDDGIYLEKLVKKWGTNYARMAQDAKLNRMQWTANQIQKKHETYQKMFPENDA